MKKIRIAINGFGRIGRAACRIALARHNVEIVAINDLTDPTTLAHLLQYDTAYGRYQATVEARDGALTISTVHGARCAIPVYATKDPAQLPWARMAVDIVLECTGRFTSQADLQKHIDAGAGAVVLSAPAKGGDVPTVVRGVSEEALGSSRIVSNASCTTNCIAPVMQVLADHFGVRKATMTTTHSYTADQRLQDAPHSDLRRARAAAANIVPTSTGAAIAATEVIPSLQGHLDGLALRVPTITVSLADITAVLGQSVTAEQVNDALRAASKTQRYSGILAVSDVPLVSSDFIADAHSSTVDSALTMVVGGDLVKVIAWYDNEWGYSNRLVEVAERMGQS